MACVAYHFGFCHLRCRITLALNHLLSPNMHATTRKPLNVNVCMFCLVDVNVKMLVSSPLSLYCTRVLFSFHVYTYFYRETDYQSADFLETIHRFLESDSEVLTFPTSLKGNERKIIHEVLTYTARNCSM